MAITTVGVSARSGQDVAPNLISAYGQKRAYLSGSTIPTTMLATTGAATGGTGGNVNIWNWEGAYFTQYVIGTQTITAPIANTSLNGTDISLDQTDNDGWEISGGATTGNGKLQFTVGTDKPFFISFKAAIADASGTDDFAVGFRGVEAYQDATTSYVDYATLGCDTSAANMLIKVRTDSSAVAAVSTSTTQTWVDAAEKTFTVVVDSDGSLGTLNASGGANGIGTVGNCFYYIDGVRPTAKPTLQFAFVSGTVVTPFIHFVQATTSPTTVILRLLEIGFVGEGQTQQLGSQA